MELTLLLGNLNTRIEIKSLSDYKIYNSKLQCLCDSMKLRNKMLISKM